MRPIALTPGQLKSLLTSTATSVDSIPELISKAVEMFSEMDEFVQPFTLMDVAKGKVPAAEIVSFQQGFEMCEVIHIAKSEKYPDHVQLIGVSRNNVLRKVHVPNRELQYAEEGIGWACVPAGTNALCHISATFSRLVSVDGKSISLSSLTDSDRLKIVRVTVDWMSYTVVRVTYDQRTLTDLITLHCITGDGEPVEFVIENDWVIRANGIQTAFFPLDGVAFIHIETSENRC